MPGLSLTPTTPGGLEHTFDTFSYGSVEPFPPLLHGITGQSCMYARISNVYARNQCEHQAGTCGAAGLVVLVVCAAWRGCLCVGVASPATRCRMHYLSDSMMLGQSVEDGGHRFAVPCEYVV